MAMLADSVEVVIGVDTHKQPPYRRVVAVAPARQRVTQSSTVGHQMH